MANPELIDLHKKPHAGGNTPGVLSAVRNYVGPRQYSFLEEVVHALDEGASNVGMLMIQGRWLKAPWLRAHSTAGIEDRLRKDREGFVDFMVFRGAKYDSFFSNNILMHRLGEVASLVTIIRKNVESRRISSGVRGCFLPFTDAGYGQIRIIPAINDDPVLADEIFDSPAKIYKVDGYYLYPFSPIKFVI